MLGHEALYIIAAVYAYEEKYLGSMQEYLRIMYQVPRLINSVWPNANDSGKKMCCRSVKVSYTATLIKNLIHKCVCVNKLQLGFSDPAVNNF